MHLNKFSLKKDFKIPWSFLPQSTFTDNKLTTYSSSVWTVFVIKFSHMLFRHSIHTHLYSLVTWHHQTTQGVPQRCRVTCQSFISEPRCCIQTPVQRAIMEKQHSSGTTDITTNCPFAKLRQSLGRSTIQLPHVKTTAKKQEQKYQTLDFMHDERHLPQSSRQWQLLHLLNK